MRNMPLRYTKNDFHNNQHTTSKNKWSTKSILT